MLSVAILGSSMAFLDGTVVNVALPVMQSELGVPVDRAQWVVEAYSLLLASLVLVGGALGDRYGRKRVFVWGIELFAAASAACGLAPGATFLIVARAFQGVGAALLVPGSLALITAAYPDERERGAAIGTWSAFSAITTAVGPLAGGWVVTHASWRWIFFFNAPLAAVVVAMAARHVDETRDEGAAPHLDFTGAALATLGLGVVTFALVDSERVPGRTRMFSILALGVAMLAAFVVVEARARAPMVPLSLFRSRTFAGANLLTLALYAALGGGLFFLPFVLIQVHGYSPAEAGAAWLPFIVLLAAMSRWAGAVASRLGARTMLAVGPVVAAAGFALLARPTASGSYWSAFFPGIVVLGIGMGITVAPLTAAVMGSVDRRHAGVASGINNAVARAAGLLAIAAFGVLLVARFDATLDQELARAALSPEVLARVTAERAKLAAADVPPEVRGAFVTAYLTGYRTVMIASAFLAALGALAALVLVEGTPRARGPHLDREA